METPVVVKNLKSWMPKHKKTVSVIYLAVSLLVVAALCFGAIALFNFLMGDVSYTSEWGASRTKAEVRAVCERHLTEAQRDAMESIAKNAEAYTEFVMSRKEGARPFAEDVVSLYGKWRALKQYIPFTEKDSHQKYIVESFGKHIFTPEELGGAIERSIEGAVKDIEGFENSLASALREVILGESIPSDQSPVANEEFKKAVETILGAAEWDAAKTSGKLVLSEAVSLVGTQVLIRLGASAGILTTGMANSGWSFGASVVIGIIVDQLWEWYDDPVGDIEREIAKALEELAKNGSDAIKTELNRVVESRMEAWEQVVEERLA